MEAKKKVNKHKGILQGKETRIQYRHQTGKQTNRDTKKAYKISISFESSIPAGYVCAKQTKCQDIDARQGLDQITIMCCGCIC